MSRQAGRLPGGGCPPFVAARLGLEAARVGSRWPSAETCYDRLGLGLGLVSA